MRAQHTVNAGHPDQKPSVREERTKYYALRYVSPPEVPRVTSQAMEGSKSGRTCDMGRNGGICCRLGRTGGFLTCTRK